MYFTLRGPIASWPGSNDPRWPRTIIISRSDTQHLEKQPYNIIIYIYIYQYIHQKTSLGPKNQEHANFHRQFHGETTCVFLAKKHWHFPVLQRQCLASQQVAWWANGFIANPCEHRRTIFCGNPAKQFFAIIYIDLALFNCDLTFLSFGNLR